MIDRKQKNIFRRALSKLRMAMFSMTSQALENNVVNLVMYLIAIVVEALQMIPFFFTIGLRVADKHPVGKPRFETLVETLMLITGSSTVLGGGFNSVMGFTFAFLVVFLVLMAIILYPEWKDDGKKGAGRSVKLASCVYKTLSFIMVALSTFATWPFFLLQIKVFTCTSSANGVTYTSDRDVTCWQGLHLAVVFVDCLNILFFLLFLIVFETLFTDTSPRSNVPWACTQANKMKLIKHLGKVTLACFAVFDSVAEFYNYLFVLEILIHAGIMYIVFMSPSYVNRICGRATIFMEALMFFTTIGMYVFRLVDVVVLWIGVVMITVLLLSLSGLTVFAKCKYDQYILGLQVATTKSESLKEYYFYELFRLLDAYSTGDPGVAIELYGIYSNHQLLCNNAGCMCSNGLINKNLEALKRREEESMISPGGRTPGETPFEGNMSSSRGGSASLFQIALHRFADESPGNDSRPEDKHEADQPSAPDNYTLLINMCTSLIDNEVATNPGSIIIRMISAYYAKEYIGNIYKCMHELMYVEEKQNPPFRDKFLIYKCKKVLGEEMMVLSKKGLSDNIVEVDKLIQFERHYETLRAQAESASNIVNRFWEQLKSKDLDVNGLYEIGSKVGTIYAEMQTNYALANAIFPQNYKIVREFGNFEKYIMNNDMVAKNYEQRARQVFKDRADKKAKPNEGDIVDVNSVHHTCICIVSGNPNTMGDIVSINNEITHNLGYKSKELVGQNIGSICPPYLSQKHNTLIENFIKRGESEILSNRRVVAACNSKGFLVLLDAFVKVLPAVEEGLRFVGIFKKVEDFAGWVKGPNIPCAKADFAYIVTSMEGQIYGINETCMTRLGIPISLFKPKGGAEDAILINTLIKDLGEPMTDEKLKGDGKEMVMDTKALQYSVNKENLSAKENKALETRTNRYRVFVKEQTANYGNGLVQIKIYKMFIEGVEGQEKAPSLLPPNDPRGKLVPLPKESPHETSSESRRASMLELRRKDTDRDEGKTNNDETSSKDQSTSAKALNEFKQLMNAKSAAINVTAIKRGVNILFLGMIILASIEFALLLNDQGSYLSSLRLIFMANRRICDIGLIHAEVFTMVRLANSSNVPLTVNGINLYEYVREYGYRSIGALGSEQDYLNTLDFDYPRVLNNLEKEASVPVYSIGMAGQQSYTTFTINTAITQYNAKAADFMSFTFNSLNALISTATVGTALYSDYFLIKENGISNLTFSVQAAEKEFRSTIKDRMGRYFPYFVGAAVLIGLSLAVCFGILVPKLVGLQREKIVVLMLYTRMNRREVNAQMAKCLEYQKENGFWDYNEENDDLKSKGSLSDEGETPEKPEPQPKTAELLMPDSATERTQLQALVAKQEENFEEDSDEDEDSDDDDKEAKKAAQEARDENEITIKEQLNQEQLRAQLTTNKCSLITLVCLVSSLYCCYFVTGAIKPLYDAREAQDSLDFVSGVSKMLKSPLYLLLYALVSVVETRTIRLGKDVVDLYLDEFLEANAFKQTITSAGNSFISSTQKLFDQLDSPQLCSKIFDMYQLIRDNYPEAPLGKYAYTVQRNISRTTCESFQDGLLTRGLTQAAFMIHQEVKKVQAERKMSLAQPNVTSTQQCLAMLALYLAPIYEGLLLDLKNSIESNLDSLKEFLILFYVFYIIASFFVHLLFWTCFLRAMETELIKSRGMLNILPLELLDKLKKLKKERDNIPIIMFLKSFEKG